jgi:glycosyltransferase involved in cell wall biosynthesis
MMFVSVIIPTRNEEHFISACLDSLLLNDYPLDRTEILVVDGMSSDRTVEIVEGYADRFPSLKVVSNPGKTFPCAVNTGYRESKGEAVMILGAHAAYDPSYISLCIKYLEETGADNVGGVMVTKGQDESFIGRAISFALTSPFGVGNAVFRTGSDSIREVDTVFGGCYRRDVFERIGLFNENLVSSSDMEFNRRLVRNGGKILLVPGIKTTYFTRSTFRKFMRNNVRNGFWVIYPLKFVDHMPVSIRHFVPLAFLLSLAGLALLSAFFPLFLYMLIALLAVYFLSGFAFATRFFSRGPAYFLVMPCFFFLLHLSYGTGSFAACFRLLKKERV